GRKRKKSSLLPSATSHLTARSASRASRTRFATRSESQFPRPRRSHEKGMPRDGREILSPLGRGPEDKARISSSRGRRVGRNVWCRRIRSHLAPAREPHRG